MKKSSRLLMTLVVPLVLVAVTLGMLLLTSTQASKRTRELTYEILKAGASEQRDLLNAKLEGELAVLDSLAGIAATSDNGHAETFLIHLQAALASSEFTDFCVTDLEGSGTTETGKSVYLGDRTYFLEAVAGNRTVAFVTDSLLGANTSALVLAVPIMQDDQVTGVIAGLIGEQGLQHLLLIQSYSGSESFVCNSKGRVVLGSGSLSSLNEKDDLSLVFENADFDKPYQKESVLADFQSQAEGFVSYSVDGAHWYLAYLPLERNDWMICTAIPGEIVDSTLNAERADGFIVIGIAMLSAALLILFVISLYTLANRQAKNERERLLIAEEEYRISAQQSGAMILRYDIEANLLMPNETANEQFKLPVESTNFDYTWALDTLVEEESRKEYQAFWAAIQAGEAGGCAEVRMTNAEGALRWYAFTFSAIKNSAGKSVQAVITVRDITIAREKLNEYEHWRAMVSALIGKSAAYIEINLTTGAAERVEGRFALKQDGAKDAAEILRIFAENYVDCGDRVKFASFLSLPRLRELLIRGVTRSESDVRLQFPNGEARLCAVSVQMSYAPDTNDAKAIVAITDPGDSGSDMERLSDLAFRDGLSGLLNRTAARAAIEEALRFGGEEPVALFMLDIDNFKRVNDSMGHQQGDQALVRIGEILRGVFRATDVIARIGGDEFFVFLTGPSLGELVEPKAAALCDALSFSYSNGSASVPISVSVGVVTARSNQVDYDSLYREADLALYEAKNAGKDRYCIRRLDQTPEPGSNRLPGASYSVQLYSLLKYVDSGVALFAVGKTIEHLFSSGGGLPSNEPGCCGIDVVHPDDLNALVNLLHICAKQGTSFETVFRRRLGDGSYGWRHMRAERIPYFASQDPVVIAAVMDITELKRSAGELESIVAATPIGIAIVRFGERMEATFFNDALLNMFGFSYEQFRLIARDCSSMLLKDNLAQLHAAVARAENDGAPLEVVFRTASQHGLGKRHIHVRGVKVDEVNGVPAYLLLLTQLTA